MASGISGGLPAHLWLVYGIRFHPENGDFHWDFIWVDKL